MNEREKVVLQFYLNRIENKGIEIIDTIPKKYKDMILSMNEANLNK